MKRHYFLMADRNFGHPITVSHSTDLFDSEAEADGIASKCIELGGKFVYLYKLERVYKPAPKPDSRDVEIIYV